MPCQPDPTFAPAAASAKHEWNAIMRFRGIGCAVLLAGMGVLLSACPSGGGEGVNGGTTSIQNTAPVSDAGVAQTLDAGSTVTLDGSASSDANGDTLTYQWTLTSVPTGSAAVLSSATAQKPSFLADESGYYLASLIVHDGKLSSGAVSVKITAKLPAGNTGKLNDTGITSAGYDTSGVYVAFCDSNAPGNDCNTGRDVTANDNSDGHAGFSFTKIAADGTALPASATSWSCVKDKVTGLIWENKTAANGALRYTNYDDTSKAQFDNGSTWVNPTQAQIDAATNSVGYKNAVNTAGLCGASDWRLPTADELLSIVDNSVALPGPALDAVWFPNTQQNAYWSSSPSAGNSGVAWGVYFSYGLVNDVNRNFSDAVRLVRSGQ